MAVLGKVVITPKGEYLNNVSYENLDCVFDGGSTWLAKQATKGNPPPTDGSESNDYWQLLARGVPIDTKDSTVTFEEAEGDAELQSGMSHSTLWGLVKFKFADILSSLANKLSQANIANNLVTTESGFVLDARQGKILQDQINEQNNNLENVQAIYINVDTTYLSGSIICRKLGKIVFVRMSVQFTESITSNTVIATGFPLPALEYREICQILSSSNSCHFYISESTGDLIVESTSEGYVYRCFTYFAK